MTLLLLCSLAGAAHAVDRTWDHGAGTPNWSDCNNWSGNVCPGAFDNAIFNGTNTADSTIDAAFVPGGVWVLDIQAGYTGTITLGKNFTVQVIQQASGTFTGSNFTLDISALDLSAGTFNAPNAAFSISQNFTHTLGGTFNAGVNTISFTGGDGTIDVNGSETFNNLTINKGGFNTLTIASGDTLVVNGTLTLTNGRVDTGTIDSYAGITHTNFDGGSATIKMSGAAVRTLNLTYNAMIGFPSLHMNAANAVVNVPADMNAFWFEGNVTIDAGTFNDNANLQTVIGGNLTINGGTFNSTAGDLQISGNFNHTGGAFNDNNGKVSFYGSAVSILGTTTFHNLAVSASGVAPTLTLTAGATITVEDTARIAPSSSRRTLTLASTALGVQANVNIQGKNSITFTDIKDMNFSDSVLPTATISCRALCVDSGNNTGIDIGDPQVLVSTISTNTTEAGGTGTFTVVLRSRPSNNVTVPIATSDATEGTVSTASLTFTNGNWNAPQIVTVTGQNDALDDGGVTYTAQVGVTTSADTRYDGLNPTDVTIVNLDNDMPLTSIDMDNALEYTHEDVKDTGNANITWFEHDTLGFGNLKTAMGGANVNLAASKIKAGCNIDIGGTFYTINQVNAAATGYVLVTPDPTTVSPATLGGTLVSAAVNSIICTEQDGDNLSLNTDFINTRKVTVSGDAYLAYDTALDANWFVNTIDEAYRYDIQAGTLGAAIAGNNLNSAPIVFDNTNRRFWVANTTNGITAINADTNAIVYANINIGDFPISLTYDSTQNAIWVTHMTNGSVDGAVTKINAATGGVIGTYTLVTNSDTGIVLYDSNDNAIWVGVNANTAFIKLHATNGTAFDTDLATSTFPLPTNGSHAVYDAVQDAIWLTTNLCDGSSNQLLKFDTTDGSILGSYTVDDCPEDLITDANYVWVSSADAFTQYDANSGVLIEKHHASVNSRGIIESNNSDIWSLANNTILDQHVQDGVAEDNYYSIINTDDSQIITTTWNQINAVDVGETLDSGNVYYSISFDARASFKVFTGGAWRVIASNLAADHGGVAGTWYFRDNGNGWSAASANNANRALSQATAAGVNNRMTGVAWEALNAGNWAAAGGFSPAVDNIDIGATFYTTDPHNHSLLDFISFDNSAGGGGGPGGFTVSAISGNTTEAGGTATFTVVLTSAPAADVSIGVTSSDLTEGTVAPASLTFTNVNWNVPQTVTVTGVNDPLVDGNIPYTVILAPAVSADGTYNGLNPNDVAAINIDDDGIPQISIADVSVNENAGEAMLTVTLTGTNPGTVTVNYATADSTALAPADYLTRTGTLIWTAGQNGPKTFTVPIVNDTLLEDNEIFFANLSNPSNAAIADGTANVTIANCARPNNNIPVVDAGNLITAKEGTRVTLPGTASDKDGDPLTYAWTQVSGQSVTIQNADQAHAQITLPLDNEVRLVFRLTVSDGTASASDTIDIVPILSEYVLSGQDLRMDDRVLFAKNKLITAQETSSCPHGLRSCFTINLENHSTIVTNSLDNTDFAINGKYLLFSHAPFDDNRGLTLLLNRSKLNGTMIDLSLDEVPSVEAVLAAKTGDTACALEHQATFFDLENDGIPEILTLSPGKSFGGFAALDFANLQAKTAVNGSSGLSLNTNLSAIGNFNGRDGTDVIFGTGSGTIACGEPARTSQTLFGLAGSNTLLGTTNLNGAADADWDIDTGNTPVGHMAGGDINGDGTDDLIVTDSDTGDMRIGFGSTELGVSETAIVTDRVILNPEDSLPAILLVDDLTGDGFADIILTYDDGNGRIYILPGRPIWEDADLTLDMAVVINGTTSNPIGEFLVTGDSDSDGEPEIFSSNGTSPSTRILTSDILVDSGNAGGGSNLLGGSAFVRGSGCSLNTHEESDANGFLHLCLLALAYASILSFKRRKKEL